jgi:hypothetical protein
MQPDARGTLPPATAASRKRSNSLFSIARPVGLVVDEVLVALFPDGMSRAEVEVTL